MIVDEQELKLLKTNSLFKGVSYSHLKSHLKPKNFFQVKEGEIIYKSDDEATEIYLIVEGEVKIKFCEDKIVKTKYILDYFGESEILSGTKRISHAIADTDCVLYKILDSEFKLLRSLFPVISTNIGINGNNNLTTKVNKPLLKVGEVIDANKDEEIISFDELKKENDNELSDDELDNLVTNTKQKQKINEAFEVINKLPEDSIDGNDDTIMDD